MQPGREQKRTKFLGGWEKVGSLILSQHPLMSVSQAGLCGKSEGIERTVANKDAGNETMF